MDHKEAASPSPASAAAATPSLSLSAAIAGLSASASHAELATALQARHSAVIGSGLQSPRTQRTQRAAAAAAAASGSKSSATAVAQLPTPPSAASPAASSAASAAAPAVSSALLAVQRSNPDSRSGKKGTYHHLPPLTEGEQKLLFDALPSLRSMDDVPAASLSLRSTSLAIIRQWLSDKLSRSAWVSLIQRIRLMAEGGDHTHANTNDRGHVLTAMGLDPRSLHTAGIPPPLVHRIYKALWVYSEGVRELVTEVSHHSRSNRVVVGNLWKCYAILLEDHRGDEYALAMMQIEQESQRVLREMEERFSKSLQLKQDSELRTQSEVKTLSTLLERSQIEARSLLEKKESLSHEILHLETANADLENLHAATKKDLWFTSNTLNRLVGKHDALLLSSAQTEQKLRQEMHELKCEQEEIKMSLDQELATNEKLSYKVDRFASNIADLTTSTARMRADLNEKVAEVRHCFAPGTLVLLYDGTSKPVESLLMTDQLMGDDSTPRKIYRLHPPGHTSKDRDSQMFTVTCTNEAKDEWSCNADHTLVVRLVCDPKVQLCSHNDKRRTGHTHCVTNVYKLVSASTSSSKTAQHDVVEDPFAEFADPDDELEQAHNAAASAAAAAASSSSSSSDAFQIGGATQRVVQTIEYFKSRSDANKRAVELQDQQTVFELSVRDYFACSKTVRNLLTMFQPRLVTFKPLRATDTLASRLCVAYRVPDGSFNAEQVGHAAWLLGLWLADGNARSGCIYQIKEDKYTQQEHSHTPVVDYAVKFHKTTMAIVEEAGASAASAASSSAAASMSDVVEEEDEEETAGESVDPDNIVFKHLQVTRKDGSEGNTVYQIRMGKGFRALLASYGILGDKRFPTELLTECKGVRLELLTGVIDGDGYYDKEKGLIQVTAKQRSLMDGLIHLCRGLGYRTGKVGETRAVNKRTGKEYDGFKINITGKHLHEINTALEYKQPLTTEERGGAPGDDQFGSSVGFTIKPAGHGKYHGFALDRNKKFLLGDFTVVHNCNAEIKLVSKVLEKTTKDCTTLEKARDELERHYEAKLEHVAQRIKAMEQEKLQRETEQLKRMEMEAEERNQAEERARAQEEAGDPTARSPIVLDLRAQLAALRASHDKEVADLSARNTLLSDRIRAQQKRIKELGGGRRFAFAKKEGEAASDSDSSSDSSEGARTPLSPRRQLESVTERLKQVSSSGKKKTATTTTTTGRRRTGDSDETNSDNSAGNSRRSSKAAAGARISEPSPTRTGSGSSAQYISLFPGNVKALAREVSSLQSELESKEKLNTNLLVSVNKLKVNLSSREEDNRRHAEQIAAQRLEISGLRDALSNESLAKATLQKRVGDQAETIESLRKTEKTCMDLRHQLQDLQKNKIVLLEAQSDLTTQLTESLQSAKALKAEAKTNKISQVKLREEIKNLRSECDQRIKNQNELGLRIRTLTMETSSLQSLNDEIQRNLKSSNDASSLLGSLETKSAEINRLFLKIRDMEHTRIEQLKVHDTKIAEVRRAAEAEVASKIEEALQTEQARTKKLRAQISDAKSEAKQVLESVRSELSSRSKELSASEEAREKAVKEAERLQKQIATLNADADKRKLEIVKLMEQHAAAVVQLESKAAEASPATKAQASPSPLSAAQQAVLSPLQIPPVSMQSPQLSPLPPAFAGVSPDSSSSSANLPTPALFAAAGADELASLVSGEASALLSVGQSATLRGLAQRVVDSKTARTALEESNFLMKNQISVLEDQLESMRTVHARIGGGGQTPRGAGAEQDGLNMRRRKHKKSVSSGVALLTDDNADYSSEDDAKRGGGVRFTREAPALSITSTSARLIAAPNAASSGNKRSSGGKNGPNGELLAGPPALNRAGSFARARKDGPDEVSASPTKDRPNTLASNRLAVNSSSKSPRSTLNKDKSPGSPAAASPPSLRRAASMDPSASAASSRTQHISGSSSPNAGGTNPLAHTPGRTPSGADSSAVPPVSLAPALFTPPPPLIADAPMRGRSHSVHITAPTGDTVEALMMISPPHSPKQTPLVAVDAPILPPAAVPPPSLSISVPPATAATVAAIGSPTAQPAPTSSGASTVTSPAPRGSPIAAPLPMSPLSVPGPSVSASSPHPQFSFATAASPSPPLPAASPPPAAAAAPALFGSSSATVLAPAAATPTSSGALSARANADRQRAAAASQSPSKAASKGGAAGSLTLAASTSSASLVPVPAAPAPVAVLLASPPASRPVTVALVAPSSSAAHSRPGRNGSFSSAASPALGGLLSPAAAMAALQQLKLKVESNQKAVNFPKL